MRGPLVRTAFALYASGDWSLLDLRDHMELLGLKSRATSRRPEKSVAVSSLQRMLTDEYYMGVVVYAGKRGIGRHEPLVSPEIFEEVQVLLSANRNGERASKHEHYLRAPLSAATGRAGCCSVITAPATGITSSTSCVNRATRRRSNLLCVAPHYRVQAVERKVEDLWATVKILPEVAGQVREDLRQYSRERAEVAGREVQRHMRRISKIEDRQSKLLDLYYEDLIPEPLFEKEQAALREEHASVVGLVSLPMEVSAEVGGQLGQALALREDPFEMNLRATNTQRRALNSGISERIGDGPDDEAVEPGTLVQALSAWQTGPRGREIRSPAFFIVSVRP